MTTREFEKWRYAHAQIARLMTFGVERRARRCEDCGATKELQVHHCDSDYTNQARDNRQVLCLPCHKRRHKKRRRLPAHLKRPKDLTLRQRFLDYKRMPWLRPGAPL